MNDEAVELLLECRGITLRFAAAISTTREAKQYANGVVRRIDTLLAQSKAAPLKHRTDFSHSLIEQANEASAAPASGEGILTQEQIETFRRWFCERSFMQQDEFNILCNLAHSALSLREREDFKPMLYEVAQELCEQLCAYLNGEQSDGAADEATKAFHKWEDDNLAAPSAGGEEKT